MTRIVTLTLNPALDLSTETDDVLPDIKLRCAAPRSDAGGGGVNVSRAIAFLGGSSVAGLALGGATGDRVRRLLAAEGIETHDLGIAAETRENLSVISRKTGRQYRFVMPGGAWSLEDVQRASDELCARVSPGDVIVVSGSLPPGVSELDLVAMTDRLSAMDVRVMVDTSGAALRAYAQGAGRMLDVLRMDLDEAESLSGRALGTVPEVASFARDLSGAGVAGTVVVAKGAEGSITVTSEGHGWHVRPPQVSVVSKTGAGDSFVAGFALAFARGRSVRDATVQGVGAAASAVTSPDTDLCNARDAARYAERSTITEV